MDATFLGLRPRPTRHPGKSYRPTAPQLGNKVFSYESDPILLQTRARVAADLNSAEASALERKRRALQAFGSRQLATQVLGANDPTIGAISDDPNLSSSTLAGIARADAARKRGTEEQLQRGHLFYSSTRANDLAQLAQQRRLEESSAATSLQDLLAEVGRGLLGAKQQGAQEVNAAEESAYERALQLALASGALAAKAKAKPRHRPLRAQPLPSRRRRYG